MNNPLDKVYLSEANLESIAEGGSITSGDDSYSADEGAIYLVPEEIGDLVQTTGQSTTDVMSQKAVTDALNANLGKNGTLTIAVADWNNGEATKTVSDLGTYDLIQFFPATSTDKTNIADADIWVSVSGTTITFTAQNTPSADITFNYFITRGTV